MQGRSKDGIGTLFLTTGMMLLLPAVVFTFMTSAKMIDPKVLGYFLSIITTSLTIGFTIFGLALLLDARESGDSDGKKGSDDGDDDDDDGDVNPCKTPSNGGCKPQVQT